MAIHKVVAVQDAKAGVFLRPQFGVHLGAILRDWETVVNDPTSMMNKYPEDFALYEIATYDDVSGQFVSEAMPRQLSTARQVQKEFIQKLPRMPKETLEPVL